MNHPPDTHYVGPPTHEEIALEAYSLWKRAGCPADDCADYFWHQAELALAAPTEGDVTAWEDVKFHTKE